MGTARPQVNRALRKLPTEHPPPPPAPAPVLPLDDRAGWTVAKSSSNAPRSGEMSGRRMISGDSGIVPAAPDGVGCAAK